MAVVAFQVAISERAALFFVTRERAVKRLDRRLTLLRPKKNKPDKQELFPVSVPLYVTRSFRSPMSRANEYNLGRPPRRRCRRALSVLPSARARARPVEGRKRGYALHEVCRALRSTGRLAVLLCQSPRRMRLNSLYRHCPIESFPGCLVEALYSN